MIGAGKRVGKLIQLASRLELQQAWLCYTLDLIFDTAGLVDQRWVMVEPDKVDPSQPVLYYGHKPPGDDHPAIPSRPDIGAGRMEVIDLTIGCGQVEEVLVYSRTRDNGELTGAVPGCDLLFNIFAYAACLEEYRLEARSGPIHSYAVRLNGENRRFDRPYANYLIMAVVHLLEQAYPDAIKPDWAAPGLFLTHDVDAVEKTWAVRGKESLFRIFVALRRLVQGRMGDAAAGFRMAGAMAFNRSDYFCLDRLASLEAEYDRRSVFNVFAGDRPPWLGRAKDWLFNPEYDLASHDRLKQTLIKLADTGWEIGIHFGFDSFDREKRMAQEKANLESMLGGRPTISSRQHWLRFSLNHTWAGLEDAGVRVDSTLGFNDRPGFRSGLATPFKPFNHLRAAAHRIWAIPTILMDSQLFYYKDLSPRRRRQKIDNLIAELVRAKGRAAIIWHTHVLTPDHGWGEEYRYLLESMTRNGLIDLLPTELVQEK